MKVSFIPRSRRNARSWRVVGGLSVAALTLVLGGCANAPDPTDPVAVREFRQINDPIEPLNRAIFTVNRGIDTMFLKPAATVYSGVLPAPVKTGVHNFLNNLRLPIVFINDLLQGQGLRARTTLERFVLNSTFGVLGFGDPATGQGLVFHGEDFGQTLANWGVADGPYLMLPILGPSNPRDATGIVADFIMDPFSRWAGNTGNDWAPWARRGVDAVDTRARNLKEIDSLERTSLDYYAAIRSLYRQHRRDQINNGAHPIPMTSPDFGSMSAVPPPPSPSISSLPHPADFGQTVEAAAQTR